MNECDLILAFGASFSNHTGITPKRPIIQVDYERMALGKFHPVAVPVWGEIGVTAKQMQSALPAQTAAVDQRGELAERWSIWRAEKQSRLDDDLGQGINSSIIFAELGNVAPAISVEGFEEDTDYRRGKGVYKKILTAIDHLRNEGVLYGISFTATRLNADNILHDDFIDEFFDTQGAAFAWMFQYMPIGRGPDFDLMITPEQRKNLWHREWEIIKDKGIFFIDFWNGGPIICQGNLGVSYFFRCFLGSPINLTS